jgi:hypothetical protein
MPGSTTPAATAAGLSYRGLGGVDDAAANALLTRTSREGPGARVSGASVPRVATRRVSRREHPVAEW